MGLDITGIVAVIDAATQEQAWTLFGLLAMLAGRAKTKASRDLPHVPSVEAREQPHLITLVEAAKRLEIDEDTARELGRTGELPTVRIGRRGVRVDVDDLREFISMRRNGLHQGAQGQMGARLSGRIRAEAVGIISEDRGRPTRGRAGDGSRHVAARNANGGR